MDRKSMSIERLSAELARLTEDQDQVFEHLKEMTQMVKECAHNRKLAIGLLERLALDADFAATLPPTIDPNDITLFRDPKGNFSIRIFVWLPHRPYPIHDHGAWGIVAGLAGSTQEVRYRRLDTGETPGYAELEAAKITVLNPGDTTVVMPLNEGIHQMNAIGETASITLHIYGKAIRKGYIQAFQPDSRRVYRMYSPTHQHRITSIHALGAMSTLEAKAILEQVARDNRPFIQEEAQNALANSK